jgi:endonuclease YncB( thermonuclease family)
MRLRFAAMLAALVAAALPFALPRGAEPMLAQLFETRLREVGAERIEVATAGIRAVDGDTLAIGATRLRLHGIDAPELHQECRDGRRALRCGEMAREQLKDLLRGAPRLSCVLLDRDHYGRHVARCTRSDGLEVNRAMVRQGWALPYVAYGGSAYAGEMRQARSDRLGLHGMRYEIPAAWRRRHQG